MNTRELFWNDAFVIIAPGLGKVEVSYSRDPEWFEFTCFSYDEELEEMEEVNSFIVPAELLPLIIRCLAVLMRTENHPVENILYMVSHKLDRYEYDPDFLQRTEQEKQGGL